MQDYLSYKWQEVPAVAEKEQRAHERAAGKVDEQVGARPQLRPARPIEAHVACQQVKPDERKGRVAV